MAINTLLQYLKDTQKTMSVSLKDCIIKDVKIDHFEINDDQLFIFTDKCHEFWIDISHFKKMRFDSIAFYASNTIEIQRCMPHLKKIESFNAYLADEQDEFFLKLFSICDKKLSG